MRTTKAVLRFLFTPRTDSPTVAFYSGMLMGAALLWNVAAYIETTRQINEWENSELGQALKEAHDQFNATPES